MASSEKKKKQTKIVKKKTTKAVKAPVKRKSPPTKTKPIKKKTTTKQQKKSKVIALKKNTIDQSYQGPVVNSTFDFVTHFGKPFYDFKANHIFVKILITTLLFIIIFFAIQSKLNDFDPTKVVLSDEYRSKIYTEIYANIPQDEKKALNQNEKPRIIDRPDPIANRQRIQLDAEIEARVRIIAVELQADDIEALLEPLENTLLTIDQLDSILGGFSVAYSNEKRRELIKKYVGAYNVETINDISVNARKLNKSSANIEFTKIISSVKRRTRGFRNRDDIQNISIAVNNEEDQILTCFNRFRRIHFDLEGYIKVEFYINPKGRVVSESIKVSDTNIKYADFIECILKKVKLFRKIPPASADAKGDYLYEKKWVFNY